MRPFGPQGVTCSPAQRGTPPAGFAPEQRVQPPRLAGAVQRLLMPERRHPVAPQRYDSLPAADRMKMILIATMR